MLDSFILLNNEHLPREINKALLVFEHYHEVIEINIFLNLDIQT